MEIYSNWIHRGPIVGHVAHLLNGGNHWTWMQFPDIAEAYGASGIRVADAHLVTHIRALIDHWIDSARESDGVDEPQKRNLNKALPGSCESLITELRNWLARNQPQVALDVTGKKAVLDLQNQKLLGLEPAAFGVEIATYWFLQLLDSPGAHRLAKCDNGQCGRYYVRKGLRTTLIKRGSYCPECTDAGSVKRIKVSREARKKRLISLAADLWIADWKQSHQHTKLSVEVAQKMTERLPQTKPITGKWVSQNRRTIEMELERRKNAAR
jgi:hypothetical protein